MPRGYPPTTVLMGVGPNNLKLRKIVREHKKGYIYTDPINITDKGKEYDSADSLDPWFDKNWKPDPTREQPPGVPNYAPPPPQTVGGNMTPPGTGPGGVFEGKNQFPGGPTDQMNLTDRVVVKLNPPSEEDIK